MSSVLVLGHSFVRRLNANLVGSWTNLGFDPDRVKVCCVGKGGGQITDLYARWITDNIQTIQPAVVLLQIGGNDLDCMSFLKCEGQASG